MAYSVSWDEGVPVGATTPAADIDTEIQKVKTSMRERLEQVMPDFDSDVLDPKLLTIQTDTLAARPAAPDYAGQMYFAYDTAVLYIGNASLAWVATGGIVEEGDDETPSQTLDCSAVLSSNQSILGGGTFRELTGWSVQHNRGEFYNGTSPTRFTAPALGDYYIQCDLEIENDFDATLAFSSNGGLPYVGQVRNVSADHRNCLSLNKILPLSAGDYVEILVANNSAPPRNVYGSDSTVFTIHRLA